MRFDPATIDFAQPQFLWLLLAPAVLLAILAWRVLVHRAESRRFAMERTSPVRESFSFASGLGFWFCVLLACSLCILALAQPRARIVTTNRAGADLIVLLDGSASMYVNDVGRSRWQRSQAFLRVLAESLSWRGDRMALALFAQRAAPQVRLTRDPNALFFFFDHLGETPPFSLENDTTWDTNIEEGLQWGLKLVETDEALLGRSPNARAFVVVSDGQAWSGRIERALRLARERGIAVHVVGVGTLAGGRIPQPKSYPGQPPQPVIRSVLDRKSLREIAWAVGAEYFEIGHEPDLEIAFRHISPVRKHAAAVDAQPSHEARYWQCLVAAAAALGAGTLLLRLKTELWWQTVGLTAALSLLVAVV